MWIKRKRDSQRQKVYDSERSFKEKIKENFPEVYEDVYTIMTLDEIEEYCLRLVGLKWFQKRWPQVKDVKLKNNKRMRGACGVLSGNKASMDFSDSTMYKLIVLHELSHACDMSHAGWHGRPFCRIFLELIKHEFGNDVRKIMRECFKENNVKVSIKTTRPNLVGKRPAGFDKTIEVKKNKK